MARLSKYFFIVTLVIFLFSSISFSEEAFESAAGDEEAFSESDSVSDTLTMDQLSEEIRLLNEKIKKMQDENEIRRQLEVTEDETYDNENEVLNAAGRRYTLLKKGVLGIEYSFRYAAYTYDVLLGDPNRVEYASSHSITNAINIEHALKDNVTISANIPFVYKIDTQSNDSSTYVTDLGDININFQFQPYQAGGDTTSLIISGGLVCPTGRSPYDLTKDKELSTGSGGYSVSGGVNLSKTIDPIVSFGNISYTHRFDITGLNYKGSITDGESGVHLDSVSPGDSISMSMGLGFSLSYKVSLTSSFQYSYQFKSDYDWVGRTDYSTEDSTSASIVFGSGWKLTQDRTVNINVSIGLSRNDPDFNVMARVPFEFDL